MGGLSSQLLSQAPDDYRKNWLAFAGLIDRLKRRLGHAENMTEDQTSFLKSPSRAKYRHIVRNHLAVHTTLNHKVDIFICVNVVYLHCGMNTFEDPKDLIHKPLADRFYALKIERNEEKFLQI